MSRQLTIDAIGFAAASLVLATFCMRSMSALRWVAIASNFIFIAYGYLGNLAPVLLLHALLLPVNAYRLMQLVRPTPAEPRHANWRRVMQASETCKNMHPGTFPLVRARHRRNSP